MVFNLGCTCPFALSLMNITVAESNPTYSSKINVPKNCNKFEECLQIFNPIKALALPSVLTVVWQGSRDWNAHCTWPIQQRYLCWNKISLQPSNVGGSPTLSSEPTVVLQPPEHWKKKQFKKIKINKNKFLFYFLFSKLGGIQNYCRNGH
jgi:hypothetical protein